MKRSPVVFLTNTQFTPTHQSGNKLTKKPATECLFTFPNDTNNGYEFLNNKARLVFSVRRHPGNMTDL